MRIYLAGPMTGIENYNRHTFAEKAELLQSKGYEVYNPAAFSCGVCVGVCYTV